MSCSQTNRNDSKAARLEPDIKVPSADALRVAQIKALEKIIPSTKARSSSKRARRGSAS
jgi:hypothetical protein